MESRSQGSEKEKSNNNNKKNRVKNKDPYMSFKLGLW